MKKIITLTALFVFVFQVRTIFPAGGEDLLASFKNRMTTLSKCSGTISYTLTSGRSFSGNFMYMAPGNINIKFTNPSGKVLVANGKKLWLYDPHNKACVVQDLDQESGMSGGILSFIKDYEAVDAPDTGEGHILKLTGNGKEFQEITLVLDSTFFITRGSFKKNEGPGFSFTISGTDFSPDIVKSVFEFSVPANTQIIKNPLDIK